MKKMSVAAAVAASIALAFWLAACAFGLEPASNANTGKTSITFTLPALPGSEPASAAGRAVVQGGGYLYIQTGIAASDAKVYGPYAASAGEPVFITDIPAGSYPYIALVYVVNPAPAGEASPVIPSTASSDGYLAALQTMWADSPDNIQTSSFRLLINVEIRANRENAISTSLIPTTNLVPIPISSYTTITLAGKPNALNRQFVKLTGVRAGFLSTGNTKMVCGASYISTDTVTLYKVGLYDSEGRLLFWDATPRAMSMSPAEQLYTSTWNGGDTYYMYFEFTYMSSGLYLTFKSAL
jgi:hypothetical protein